MSKILNLSRKLKEIMKLSGISMSIQWLSWFVWTFGIYIMNISVTVFLLKVGSDSVPPVFKYVNWKIIYTALLVYQLNITVTKFLICTVCDRSRSAAYLGMAYYLTTNIALFIGNMFFLEIPPNGKLALSFLGNIGIGFALRIAVYQDIKREELTWMNVLNPSYQDQYFSMGSAMIMMMVGTAILSLIFFYVEFIVKGTLCQKTILAPAYYQRKTSRASAVDMEGLKKRIGLALKGVKLVERKNKVVVDNLSFNVYYGEVTALLGNHESGKGNILAMIIGLIQNTEGAILINNKDAATDILARRSLGYCPQKNIVFLNLTVAQNIKFFARMRGLSKKYMNIEIRKYCKLLKMDRDIKVRSLSIAKRRKLSIVAAFCGRTSVVVLDEPSFQTDPMTKREIWEIIHKEKEARAILISTNYMDEADMLGDRIAIMFEGKLVCYGTTFFLKKKYGSGYILVSVFIDLCLVNYSK